MSTVMSVARRERLKPVVSTIVGWASLALGLYFALSFILDSNDDVWKMLIGGVAVIVSVVFVLVTIVGELESGDKTPFPINLTNALSEETKEWLGPISAWFTTLGAIPIICGSLLWMILYAVHLPADSVVVMDNGRVLSGADNWTLSDRYEVHSVVVPLRMELVGRTELVRPGPVIHAVLQMEISLKDDYRLADFLRRAGVISLGLGSSDIPKQQNAFFIAQLRPLLDSKIDQVIKEVEEGSLSGARASMLLRLRTLVEADKANVPPWLAFANVSNIDVEEWTMSP